TWLETLTSAPTPMVSPAISRAASSAVVRALPLTTTRAPSAANRSARARPMPRVDPVTIATRPASSPTPCSSQLQPTWATVCAAFGDRPSRDRADSVSLEGHRDGMAGERDPRSERYVGGAGRLPQGLSVSVSPLPY